MDKPEPLSKLLTLQQRDEACQLYKAGLNCPEIGSKFDVTGASIRNLLKSRGIPRRPSPTGPMHSEIEHAEICQEYLGGKPSVQIAKERSLSVGTITNVLRRSGVQQRSGSERNRIYTCDYHFFDTIDSETKAYWLGLIAADGYVSKPVRKSNPEVVVSLAIKDKEHLYNLKAALQSTHPVRKYAYTGGSGKCTGTPYVSFSIRSEEMALALAKYGVTTAKCHTFEWPTLPPSLERHFLRGYFDGDGYWNIKQGYRNGQKMSHWRPDMAFRLTSDQRFLVGCARYLKRTCSLNDTKLSHRYWKGKYSASTLIYSGRESASRIFHLMYDDATIYLPRKYERALPHIL